MRKLVTIRKLENIRPINGADRIMLGSIDGWDVVIEKGKYEEGELVVYFEIDSVIPITDFFSFLSKYNKVVTNFDGSKGYLIKTLRMNKFKVLSQGLVMKIQDLIDNGILKDDPYSVGEDVTEQVGVVVYDDGSSEFDSKSKKTLGSFPSFIPKTDQERIQNLPEYFEIHRKQLFECTEKLDGSSGTIYYHKGKIGVCSRTQELDPESDSPWTRVNKMYKIGEKLQQFCEGVNRNLALQGEVVGPSIQKNRLGLPVLRFYVYDIFDIDDQEYLFPYDRMEIVESLELDHVPILYNFNDVGGTSIWTPFMKGFGEGCSSIEELLDLASRYPSVLNEDKPREGIVFKSLGEQFDIEGREDRCVKERISFKVINNNYLT